VRRLMRSSWPGTMPVIWSTCRRPEKAELPLPVFTNTWLVQPADKGPGDYPSGGPEPLVIDIWKAGGAFDRPQCAGCLPGDICRGGGAVPSCEQPAVRARVARRCIRGGERVLCDRPARRDRFFPFRRRQSGTTGFLAARSRRSGAANIESLPLPKAYAILSQLSSLILEHQASGTIAAALLRGENRHAKHRVGELRAERRPPARSTRSQPGPGARLWSVHRGWSLMSIWWPAPILR